MGYYIKFLPKKKSLPCWKVQYISWKKEDTKNSSAQKPKREWDISKSRWPSLGFHPSLSIEEAKARARQLNAQIDLKQQEERIKKLEEEDTKLRKRFDSVLPMEFVSEFEARFIRQRDSQTDFGKRKCTRAHISWKAAQKMIVTIGVEPTDWFYHTHQIYDYFYSKQYSLRYLSSILKIANLWGYFISKKMARPFLPVFLPRGYERQRLIDANNQKTNKVSRPSKPIGPEHLHKIGQTINRKNFNWLYLSVWFGLRPQDLDNLHRREFWRIETLANGRKILWVFQTKIIALPPEDRWKPIPIIFDEQYFGLRIIESQSFKRPLLKTMRKYLGPGTTLYAGRKGFVDLMLSRGQSFENISIWMGHSSLQRTWKSYKNRRRFHLAGY